MTDCLSCSCNSPAPNTIQPEGIRVNKAQCIALNPEYLGQGESSHGREGEAWVVVMGRGGRKWCHRCLPFTWQMGCSEEEVPAADLSDQVPDTESETKILLQGEMPLDPNPRRPRTVLEGES